MRTRIIYEDKNIIIAYKPAGLATQTAKIGQADVVSELKNHLASGQNSKVPYLGVIHRLDQPVEGLLVFARDKKTAAALTAQLGAGTLNKQYYALVCGKISGESGELVDYLYKDKTGIAQVVTGRQGQYPESKKAILQYRMTDVISAEEDIYLMDIHIETGRFHQIRAQMAHAGMPLLGDNKYGTENSLKLSREKGIRNVALCAYKLELTHPVSGKYLTFVLDSASSAFMTGK